MREVHTICRPFLVQLRQRTGIDSSSSVTAPTGGEPGTGTAICAQCGLSEEIASRLGGGEIDPNNDKWYCKACWDQFYSAGMAPTEAGEADYARQEGGRGQDDEDVESYGAIAMTADADEMHQDVDAELTMNTDDEADAT